MLRRLARLFRSFRRTAGLKDDRNDNPASAARTPNAVAVSKVDEERAAIESLVGMPVVDLELYRHALRHRSLMRRKADSKLASNERLEFLGDAVLGFVVAEYLYVQFRTEDEGFLTRLRSKLVNGSALAESARGIDLGRHVRMSDNMMEKGGRDNTSIMSDAFEAVIGALYLDLGIEASRDFIHRTLLKHVDLGHLARQRDNHKSVLLEHIQAQGLGQPVYRIASESGPSHDKKFVVEVLVNEVPFGIGSASSKKNAEQRAAADALAKFEEEDADAGYESLRSLTAPGNESP